MGNTFSGQIVPELFDLPEQRRLQAIVDDDKSFFHSRRL
jgi:hypothetical protein